MKILYVLNHEYERMPIHSVEVIEELNRQGHRVTVLAAISRPFLQRIAWPDTIQIHRVPIVNVKGLRAFSFFVNALILLPFWCLRESPHIAYDRFSVTSLATLWVTRLLNVPLVLEVNGIVSDELALSRSGRWRRQLFKLAEGWVFRGGDHLITVTEGLRQWIGSDHRVSLKKIDTILNGTNPCRFKPHNKTLAQREFGLDPGRPVVGYLGSLFPWWRLDLLIEASPLILAKFPDVLFLIGGGQKEMKGQLEKAVKRLSMEKHFVFQGEVPWDKAALFISAFDVAVAPLHSSKSRSGVSPLKLYAYLACGRPVVGSDIEGLGDVLTRERVGVSFPSGDAEKLAGAIIQLLQNRELAQSMGERGRQLVLDRFTWEQVVQKTVRIFQDILESRLNS